MTEQPAEITVHIKYKDVENTFSGSVKQTWLLLNKFFGKVLPQFEIANQLWLSADLEDLAKDLEGIIAYSPEGSNLLLQKSKITDNETLLLWLLASFLGNKLGFFQMDSLSKEELREKLGKSGKITSTRLGELVKTDLISRDANERYRITTFGVIQTQKEVLPRIRSKTKS